jgi:ferredoxin-type protein NapH
MDAQIISDLLGIIFVSGLILAGILTILIWIKNRTRKVSIMRLFIQLAFLFLIYYSFTFLLWLNYFLLIIFVSTFFVGRFFCGWLCPFGLYMDIIALVRKALKIKYLNLSERVNRALHSLRYIIAAVILVLPLIIGVKSYEWSSPHFLYLNGPFKPLNLFLGPIEPLFLPHGSLFGFSGISLSYPYTRDITFWVNSSFYASIAIYVFVVLTVASTFTVRRFWCRFCPTGISLAAINRVKKSKWLPTLHLSKSEEKCTKCGICKRVCPVQVAEVYEQKGGDISTSMCLLCTRCVEMCPYDGCLKVNLGDKTVFQSRNWLEPSEEE